MLHGKDAVAGSGWLDVGKPDGSGAPAAVGQHAMFVGQVILAMRIA